jgi:hypothetical protein
MYCPQCGAEYRQGFTTCSDCHVFLVHERPDSLEQESVSQPGDPNKDPFCSFWKGTDARICAELCTVLDEAGIPHKTIHRADHLFNIASQVPYELGVPASLYERAELAVKEAFGDSEERSLTPAQKLLLSKSDHVSDFGTLSPLLEAARGYAKRVNEDMVESSSESPSGPADPKQAMNEDPEEWFAQDATAEAWAGDPPELQEIIEMSLRENDIRTRWESRSDKPVLFVLPADESRACEIIREILESSLPE